MTENFTQQISFELLKTLIINHTMSTFREGGTFYVQRLTMRKEAMAISIIARFCQNT